MHPKIPLTTTWDTQYFRYQPYLKFRQIQQKSSFEREITFHTFYPMLFDPVRIMNIEQILE